MRPTLRHPPHQAPNRPLLLSALSARSIVRCAVHLRDFHFIYGKNKKIKKGGQPGGPLLGLVAELAHGPALP
jgi:hypothetical protein